MSLVMIFRIKNRQEQYAECFHFYNQLFWRKNLTISEIPSVCIGYFLKRGSRRNYPYEIENGGILKWDKDSFAYAVQYPDKLSLHFHVLLEEDQDIVNFIYYFASCQTIDVETSLAIDTRDISDDMKIGEYLYFLHPSIKSSVFIRTKEYVERYGVIHHLPGTVNSRIAGFQLTKFLPLLEISYKTYEYLASPVSRYVPKGCDTLRHNEKREKADAWEIKLLDTCKKLFTHYSSERSTELFHSKEFYVVIKNIPMLTFLFLCAFRYHCKERRGVFDIEELRLEISDARDFSEGILQIIENIVFHSQCKKGYFSFRIHDRYISIKKDKREDNIYLKREYGQYLSRMDQSEYETYLELFVVDSCFGKEKTTDENVLCKRFILNLKERGEQDGRSHEFISHFQELNVADFFKPEIWQGYYEQPDNIIEHYGIQLFDKIVTSCDGLFELISTDGYRIGSKNFYCSEGTNTQGNGCISGTQYRILLPLARRNFKQDYTGMDFGDLPEGGGRKYLDQEFFLKTVDFSKEILNDYRQNREVTEKKLKTKLVEYTKDSLFENYKQGLQEAVQLRNVNR